MYIYICIYMYISHRGKKTLNSLEILGKRRATRSGSTNSSYRFGLQIFGY